MDIELNASPAQADGIIKRLRPSTAREPVVEQSLHPIL